MKVVVPMLVSVWMLGCSVSGTDQTAVVPVDAEKLAQFQAANQPKPNMAKVFFYHNGAFKQKTPSKQVNYSDIQLEGQARYRFKQGEYVAYDVPAGRYDIQTWSVCGRANDTVLNEGDTIHPDKAGFHTKTYRYSQNSLFKESHITVAVNNVYVYNYQPNCWVNIHDAGAGMQLMTFMKLQDVKHQPLSKIYNKVLATQEIK